MVDAMEARRHARECVEAPRANERRAGAIPTTDGIVLQCTGPKPPVAEVVRYSASAGTTSYRVGSPVGTPPMVSVRPSA